jgi:hypothetical protein
MKTLAIFLMAWLLVNAAQAEGCFPEGITFSSQSQINSFRTAFPGCAQIMGGVTISGSNITNLNGLNIITSIGGNLIIESNPALVNLSGLENLSYVGGDFYLQGNLALNDLSGLNGLGFIGGDVIISDNLVLNTLTGLAGLTSLSGTLWIDDNPVLQNLNGLNNITQVDGLVRISANEQLTSLDGLSAIQHIGGSLIIGGQGHLGGIGNPLLSSIAGLSQLTTIGGSLEVEYNESLTSLSGLDNIEPGTINGLSVYHNDLLSECEVASVCAYIASPGGALYIGSNMTGCNSVEEVHEACLIISANQQPIAFQANLWPNPVESMLTAELPGLTGTTQLQLMNLQGQVLQQYTVNTLVTNLDMTGYPAGMYMLKIYNRDMVKTLRFVKR